MNADAPTPEPSTPTPAPDRQTIGQRALEVWNTIRRLGPAAVLGVLATALPPISGILLIAYMKTVAQWLRSNQDAGVYIYTGAFAVLSGLALLPTFSQAALGGYAFGFWVGLGAAMFGFAGGSMLGYEIARRASADRVMRLIDEHPKWRAVRDALVQDRETNSFLKTTGMVALLRMPPNSPFSLTNLVMASVKVPRGAFVVGTVVGMLPRTAVAVWIGAVAAQHAQEADGLDTPRWLVYTGIGMTLVVLLIVMKIAERAVKRMTAAKPDAVPTPSA